MEKIIIFDTTLRDGEQAPGASLNQKEKLDIALALEKLGVDAIEAGFPISSPGDFAAVKLIAGQVKRPAICALARAIPRDIDAAFSAVKPAKHPRIHVFLATSKIHMRYKLKKAEGEILRLAAKAVKYARNVCDDIEFSPEDASRTERQFLYRVIEAVIAAGAKTVNIPDTVGYAEPYEFGSLIRSIRENVPNVHKAVISVHCHNDLGLAVANSLAAVKNGARQVECTINGIGERAGNASLEEIVMGLKVRRDSFSGLKTSVRTEGIYNTSRLVSKLTGFAIAPNKAIVGSNAFRHEAGIHQDGVLKKRSTYEIILPEDVGFKVEGLVLGKHSGRHAFKERLKKLGYKLKEKEIDGVFKEFKLLADKKKEVFDDDLMSLVQEKAEGSVPSVWRLDTFTVTSGNRIKPSAKIKLTLKGKAFETEASGDGPVDACYKAIEKIIRHTYRLLDYSIRSVTRGEDALGEVNLRLDMGGKEISGRSSSTDIVEASIKAYIQALNKIAHLK
ncbi:2-isopropylmalate synthase [bacterium]|nr:MAG: 2-isopropylmalate synthase [bacterium]